MVERFAHHGAATYTVRSAYSGRDEAAEVGLESLFLMYES